jgi:hypothetical protein
MCRAAGAGSSAPSDLDPAGPIRRARQRTAISRTVGAAWVDLRYILSLTLGVHRPKPSHAQAGTMRRLCYVRPALGVIRDAPCAGRRLGLSCSPRSEPLERGARFAPGRALLSPVFLQVVNFTTYAAGRATAIMRAFERIQHRAMSPLPTASIRLFARHYASHPTFELSNCIRSAK